MAKRRASPERQKMKALAAEFQRLDALIAGGNTGAAAEKERLLNDPMVMQLIAEQRAEAAAIAGKPRLAASNWPTKRRGIVGWFRR